MMKDPFIFIGGFLQGILYIYNFGYRKGKFSAFPKKLRKARTRKGINFTQKRYIKILLVGLIVGTNLAYARIMPR